MIKQYLANSWFFPRHISRKYMRQLVFDSRKYAQGTILDIGCGMRPYETIIREAGATSYIGLDWPASSDKARQDVTCDAACLPLKDNAVDTVLAFELMEHLPDTNRFLTEVARVLRNSGILILSVPFMEPLHEEPRDYYRFTPHGLHALLERHGFSIKWIRPRGGWWSVALGSFIPQSLYEMANPLDPHGQRQYRIIPSALVLPFCALFQFIGFSIDQIFSRDSKYTLGFFVVAVRDLGCKKNLEGEK